MRDVIRRSEFVTFQRTCLQFVDERKLELLKRNDVDLNQNISGQGCDRHG
jgi:hypothetical protein